ncbi:MAG: DNA polymerase III subunit delta' [Acidisphaera sp.]|nr:DNA polymerase III subunit delta' [Acidisphaera sp.]
MSGLEEPRANPWLVGHVGVEAELCEAMRSGRLHHAWLLSGPAGVGKATLAFRFARRLLAGGVPAEGSLALPEKHPTFRRVTAGSHADLLTIEREWDEKRKRLRGEIVVDNVREIAGFLHLTPAEGGWRVVIVDGAENLNRSAENALLKLLEEPPPRAVVVLACSAAGRLLPTIRSRCRRLRLDPLAADDMAAVLARALPAQSAAQRQAVIAAAEGSPGRALQLADGEAVQAAGLVAGIVKRMPALTAEDAFATADALGRSEESWSTFMDLLRATLSRAVRDAARERADAAQRGLLGARPLAGWVDVWQALSELQRETEDLYLDRRQALLDSFALIADGVADGV